MDALINNARSGDKASLDLLLKRVQPITLSVCQRIVSDYQMAQDANQDALLKIASNIALFDGRSAFSSWCYRVAANCAIDVTRKRRAVPVESIFENEATLEPALDNVTADRLLVEPILKTIPTDYRICLVLVDMLDWSYDQVAQELHIPIGTVRSRISRGRKLLATELKRRGITSNYGRSD